jgi:hypothetical protein
MAVQHPSPATPFAPVGNQQLEALKQLADIFQRTTNTPSKTIPKAPPTREQPLPSVLNKPLPPALPRVVNKPLPEPLPRMVEATVPTSKTSPTPMAPHRYPTRHTKSTQSTQEEVNHVMEDHQKERDTPAPMTTTITQWANAIIDPDTWASMEYRHLIKSPKHQEAWKHSFANELKRLAQGIGGRI